MRMTQPVGKWLEVLGLGELAAAFEENAIDWEVIPDPTDATSVS